MSRVPSYLIKNSYGIWIVQVRTPTAVLNANPGIKPIYRKSTRTKDRRAALKIARSVLLTLEETWYGDGLVAKSDEHPNTGVLTLKLDDDPTLDGSLKTEAKGSELLHQLCAEYIEYQKRHLSDSSVSEYSNAAELMIWMLESSNVRSVTNLTGVCMRLLADDLYLVPKRCRKKYPDLTWKQVKLLGDPDVNGLRRVANIAEYQKNFLQWMEDRLYIDDVRKLKKAFKTVKKPKKSNKTKFEVPELQCMFHHPKYRTLKYDLNIAMLLALYTGMRRGEIFQLTRQDIYRVNNVVVIDINLRGDNRLKNESAIGIIPIPSELLTLSLDTVLGLPWPSFEDWLDTKSDRLFPKESRDKFYKFSNVSKRFRTHLDRCDITDPNKTFHSFRHTARTLMTESDIPPHIINAVLRHDKQEIAETYTHTENIANKAKYLDQLTLPFLKLRNNH